MSSWNFDRVDREALFTKLIDYRRDFHRYPEPGWLEYRTTSKIIERLEEMGVPYRFGPDIHNAELRMGLPSAEVHKAAKERAVAEGARPELVERMADGFTGVVATVEGALPGPTIAIRVDIDSNDLIESVEDDHMPYREGFASVHHGAMHGCGHDGHAAIGLGIVEMLNIYKDQLKGKVIVIFQAAEEGGRGAESVAKSGILADTDYFLSSHMGIRANRTGLFAAGTFGHLVSTKFDGHFKGVSAHAGNSPELGHNALAAAAAAVTNLLAIARTSKGTSRINIGGMQAGPGRNVIPDYAVINAETRGVTGEINDYMFDSAMHVCAGAAQMYQCEFTHTVEGKTTDAPCDEALVKLAAQVASEMDAFDEVREMMDFGAGEDVTFLMREVQAQGGQATLMLIGSDLKAPHHNRKFDFDEAVIPVAVELYTKLVFAIGEQAKG